MAGERKIAGPDLPKMRSIRTAEVKSNSVKEDDTKAITRSKGKVDKK